MVGYNIKSDGWWWLQHPDFVVRKEGDERRIENDALISVLTTINFPLLSNLPFKFSFLSSKDHSIAESYLFLHVQCFILTYKTKFWIWIILKQPGEIRSNKITHIGSLFCSCIFSPIEVSSSGCLFIGSGAL